MKIFHLLLLAKIVSSSSSLFFNIDHDDDYTFVKDYLYNYGYIVPTKIVNFNESYSLRTNTISNSQMQEGLRIFQDYWNLTNSDQEESNNVSVNSRTLEFMKKKRCGVSDESALSNYNLHAYKWYKSSLNWYFYIATNEMIATAKRAFAEWSNVTGLTFKNVKSRSNANIIITFSPSMHNFIYDRNRPCTKLLNGSILGHAYFPTEPNSVSEIHLSMNEVWFNGLGVIPENKVSLYWVLMHEIGHSLGFAHSVEGGIMFPTYGSFKNTDMPAFNKDDLNGIKAMYNNNQLHTTTTATTTIRKIPTTTIVTTTSTRIVSPVLDNKFKVDSICKIASPSNFKFFIFNRRMYVFYNKWVWAFNLREKKYKKAQLITQWLSFLPRNFTSITAIYERPLGDIALFSDNKVYVFDPQSFTLASDWPKTYQELFGDSFPYDGVQAAVLTSGGKTYLFYNNIYAIQIDECFFKARKYILIMDLFKGLTLYKNNYSVFKYQNGKIYIIQDRKYYE